MGLIICALATYKVVQTLDALTPREAMPWVKVVVASLVAFGVTALSGMGDSVADFLVTGFAISALAGTMHTVLRLLTLLGDKNRRPNR